MPCIRIPNGFVTVLTTIPVLYKMSLEVTGMAASLRRESASQIPARFCEGDTVDVLNAFLLPKIEEVTHTGTIRRVDVREPELPDLYWISGLAVARTAHVLRLVKRGC